MNNIESSSDYDSSNKVINNNNNRNNIVNNSRISDSENRNINISDSENSIVTNNEVNNSIGVNRVNLSNFLNNEWVNIYVTWYTLYNFLLGGREVDIIDLN